MTDKVTVYLDSAAEWRWARRSENGAIVATSGEGYLHKQHALRMAAEVNVDAEVVVAEQE